MELEKRETTQKVLTKYILNNIFLFQVEAWKLTPAKINKFDCTVNGLPKNTLWTFKIGK